MAKLIVEEGGKRRRFRLNPGKLTIGSGEEATLHLTSQGVARIHAVLVFKDGVVTIEPEAGVAPLKVGGKSH
ncbi:MAG: FHA domain-containing protein, partial [Planctomycetota bacterium]|nr:FHA domain-containing protein [Planctomycetota bacterium]